ncbi:hypothetical protein PIB30_016240 [Stylosanthes scabra]|uniref:Growth-regulating factor n=1 Tax=Stylosanthes scabra TaxID=79078 RepID=A0ABU6X5N0_9FABA|nr:hypothetical protein [Stylosanthes scabra]
MSSRFPFTPSQWQELEHQALIFKYMASGITIPPHLLKRSHFHNNNNLHFSSAPTILPHHQPPSQHPHFGWKYIVEMGLGRKVEREPGRCRRTDGKKWRCSKEAYPDSKYCERHMHRGKNRSRKPVELLFKTTNTNNINASSPTLPTNHHTPFKSSSPAAFSFQDDTNTAPSRYVYGVKEDVDERAFFTEPSGTMKSFSGSSTIDDPWQLTPLTMISSSSSSSSTKQRSCTTLSNNSDYSYLQLQNLNDHSKKQEEEHHHHHEKTTVHSFFDEWPHKGLDSHDKSCSSTTKLSISIPTSFHDFPILQFKNSNLSSSCQLYSLRLSFICFEEWGHCTDNIVLCKWGSDSEVALRTQVDVGMTSYSLGQGNCVLGCSMARRESRVSIELGIQTFQVQVQCLEGWRSILLDPTKSSFSEDRVFRRSCGELGVLV